MYQWVNSTPIFFWYQLLPTTYGPQKFPKIRVYDCFQINVLVPWPLLLHAGHGFVAFILISQLIIRTWIKQPCPLAPEESADFPFPCVADSINSLTSIVETDILMFKSTILYLYVQSQKYSIKKHTPSFHVEMVPLGQETRSFRFESSSWLGWVESG